MAAPDFWIIAGPNGAGKTTLMSRGQFAGVLPAGVLINPDDITLDYLRGEGIQKWADAPLETQMRLFAKAANEAQRRLENTIHNGGIAAVESVLSTQKYCPLVEQTLLSGGRFYLVYVLLSSPEISQCRVAGRFKKGGHDVPADKLVRRWQDSLALAPWFASRATEFWLVDNSNEEEGIDPVLLVSGANGLIATHAEPTPEVRPVIEAFVSMVLASSSATRWQMKATMNVDTEN